LHAGREDVRVERESKGGVRKGSEEEDCRWVCLGVEVREASELGVG
jgi:hypothetical protein